MSPSTCGPSAPRRPVTGVGRAGASSSSDCSGRSRSMTGSGPLPLGGPKQRAVLAHLIVRANALVPAETLIDLVWGDEPPETARSIIHTYVSLLRRALGAERIQGQAPGYRLRVDRNELDTVRFDALVSEARRQCRSIPDLAVSRSRTPWPCGAGRPWPTSPTSAALRRGGPARRASARGPAGADRGAAGDWRPAGSSRSWRLAGRGAPVEESLWGMLMLALYREGRQAEALSAFHRARESWRRAGHRPVARARRLHDRILEQDPGLELRGEPLTRLPAPGEDRRRPDRGLFGPSSPRSVATSRSRSSTSRSPPIRASSGDSNGRRRPSQP